MNMTSSQTCFCPEKDAIYSSCRTVRHATVLVFSISVVSLMLSSVRIGQFSWTTNSLPKFNRIRPQQREADIAFFLQISNATVHHLPRLIDRLYHQRNVYVIHFDSKIEPHHVELVMAQVQEQQSHHISNIHVMQSELVTYRGISMVLNTLSAMSFLLQLKQEWDFFINLSGADYPLLKPVLHRRLLGETLEMKPLFLTFGRKDRWMTTFRKRALEFHYDEALNHQKSVGVIQDIGAQSPLFNNMNFVPVFGGAWMILPRQFSDFCVRSPEAKKLLVAMGYMTSSPEHYFVSLAYNNPVFNSSIIPTSMRHIIWHAHNMSNGRHPLDLDTKGSTGYIFEKSLRGSTKFFARKFRNANSVLMDTIDGFSNNPSRVKRVEIEFRKRLERLQNAQ